MLPKTSLTYILKKIQIEKIKLRKKKLSISAKKNRIQIWTHSTKEVLFRVGKLRTVANILKLLHHAHICERVSFQLLNRHGSLPVGNFLEPPSPACSLSSLANCPALLSLGDSHKSFLIYYTSGVCEQAWLFIFDVSQKCQRKFRSPGLLIIKVITPERRKVRLWLHRKTAMNERLDGRMQRAKVLKLPRIILQVSRNGISKSEAERRYLPRGLSHRLDQLFIYCWLLGWRSHCANARFVHDASCLSSTLSVRWFTYEYTNASFDAARVIRSWSFGRDHKQLLKFRVIKLCRQN